MSEQELIARFTSFAAQWRKGSMRDDVIYEFTDRAGTHIIRASDLQLAADTITSLLSKIGRLEEALVRLRDCDWVISLPDRMDAVRDIARAALREQP